jgi:prepilin-type N-terminal cleavage/methylation domain-containing protein
MGRHGSWPSNRSAYTLLEMLIVLAVLAVLATLSWPVVRGMLRRGELRSAAKQVRAALTKGRLSAMETGVPHRFRYRPGTGRFEVGPLPASLDEDEVRSASARTRQRRDEMSAEDSIPSSVRFAESATARDGSDPPAPRSMADDAGWSAPTVFFPNGRSSDARIRLAGADGFFIEVSLRGLAGSTRISPPERLEERP